MFLHLDTESIKSTAEVGSSKIEPRSEEGGRRRCHRHGFRGLGGGVFPVERCEFVNGFMSNFICRKFR